MNKPVAIRPLHIHVSAAVPVEDLHEDDNELPGVYLTEVDASLPDRLAAWGALEAFHRKNGIEELDDFVIAVFDPLRKKYIEQDDPKDSEEVFYRYCGKLSDELPKVTLRLTLDVTYNPGRVDTQLLKEMLSGTVEYGIGNGGLTGNTPAEVENQSISVEEIGDGAADDVTNQDREFVLLTQPGTAPADESDRTYVPIDARNSDDAERQVLDINSETQIIAVFERVK